MLSPPTWILIGLTLVSFVFYALGTWAALKHTSSVPFVVPEAELPPVSLLKPIKGVEDALEDNLRSFFEQEYPAPIEIIFASAEPDDPGIAVARRVAADYPHVETRFTISDRTFGLNPKVSNLAAAYAAARHDLVLQSDANVRVRRDYLRRTVSELIANRADMLTSIVVGVGERTIGAAMENLQLSAFIVPAVCLALRLARITVVIGKTMLFRRSDLDALGGLARYKDVLAEDYMIGVHYARANKRIVLSTTPAENVNVDTTVERFMSRHVRWLKMRVVVHVPGFVADLLANPVAIGVFAVVASGLDPRVVAGFIALVIVKAWRDATIVRRTRGAPMKLRHIAIAPLKDIVMGAIWPYAAVSRSVEWRGARLRLGRDSKLSPDDLVLVPSLLRLPVRLLRRIR